MQQVAGVTGLEQPTSSEPTPGEVLAAILLGGFAVTQIVAMPLLAPLLAGAFGVSGEATGLIGLGNLLGTALGSLLVTLRLKSLPPRRTTLVSTLLACIAQLAICVVPNFSGAIIMESLAGFGAGVLLALSAAIVGASKNPDRGFAFILALQAAVAVIVLLAIPALSAAGALFPTLAFMVVMQGVLVPAAWLLRRTSSSLEASQSDGQGGQREKVTVVLLAGSYFAFSAAVGVVWVYSGVLGGMAGLAAGPIGQALAIGNVAAVIGSLLAALIATRFGRLLPLASVCAILLGGVIFFQAGMSLSDFYVASNLYLFAWGCGLPLFMGAVAEADSTERVTALLPVMSFAGMGVGPAVASMLPGGGLFFQVIAATIGFVIAALALAGAGRGLARA